MISLTCTACQTKLSIDDAFAGGVCRCQHCGTIQTVPGKRPGSPRVSARPQKTLYQQRPRSEQAPGTGLDELADAVATSSGLRERVAPSAPAPPPPQPIRAQQPEARKNPMMQPMLIGAGAAVIVVLLVVIVMMSMRGDPPATPPAPAVSSAETNAPVRLSEVDEDRVALPPAGEATFCGVKLDVPSVIYLLDRGSATQSSFGYLKEAAYRSIESLGADRKFQIIFWHNGTEAAYPNLITYATKDNLTAIKRSAEDLAAFGQTDLRPSLERAITQQPGAVVIATAKGWELDDTFVEMVLQVRGSSNVRIHTFNIGATPSAALKTVAEKCGGEYRDLSESDLQAFSQ